MKNILITGHSGFIGTHLVNFLKKDAKIIGFYNNINKKNGIIQIKKDILKFTSRDVPRSITSLIHLAGITSVQECEKFPEKCFKINVNGTQRMLEIARKKDCKFVFASTSHVYGDPVKLPVKEKHSTKPTSVYSASKLAAEICCETYSKTYGLDVSIFRLFSIYGPLAPKFNIVNRIISQGLENGVIKLGNLYPKRDFVYVDDAIKAIDLVVKNTRNFNTYNIGCGRSYSIKHICEVFQKISGKKIILKSLKSLSRKNEISDIYCDNKKIRKMGWRPKLNIRIGLEKTINNFNSGNKI